MDQRFVGAETVVLNVKINQCGGCMNNMKKSLRKIGGVERICIDAAAGKIAISGSIGPYTLAKILRKIKKKSELLVQPMHAPCCSNNQAMHTQHSHCCQPRNCGCTTTDGGTTMGYPAWPGNLPSAPPAPDNQTSPEMNYNHPLYSTFSDDNPHGCKIM